MKNPKTAFFGTSKFAVGVLAEFVRSEQLPALIVTTPDKPQGRKMVVAPPPVKVWAQEKDIDVVQPEKLDEDFIAEFRNTDWNLFIVASYGKILPKVLLDIPEHGTLNVHPSLLPKFRGATPIQSTILADKKETGVTILLIDEKVDHGPIVAQASVTSEEWPLPYALLEDLLAHAGGELLAEIIPAWINSEITPEEQDHNKATFTKQIKKEDGLIDLNDDPYQNYLKVLAYERWPGTFFYIKRGGKKIRIKIVTAKYVPQNKKGMLEILRIIPEGKKEMDYKDFLRG